MRFPLHITTDMIRYQIEERAAGPRSVTRSC